MFSLGKNDNEKLLATAMIMDFQDKIRKWLVILSAFSGLMTGFMLGSMNDRGLVGGITAGICIGLAFYAGGYGYVYIWACALFLQKRIALFDEFITEYTTEEMLSDFFVGGPDLVSSVYAGQGLLMILGLCITIWAGAILGIVQLPTYLRCKRKIKAYRKAARTQ